MLKSIATHEHIEFCSFSWIPSTLPEDLWRDPSQWSMCHPKSSILQYLCSYLLGNLLFAEDIAHVTELHLPSYTLTRLFCLQSQVSNIADWAESLTTKPHSAHCIYILEFCNLWSCTSFSDNIKIYLFYPCPIINNFKPLQSIVEEFYIYKNDFRIIYLCFWLQHPTSSQLVLWQHS